METISIITLIISGGSLVLTGVYVLLTLRIANKTAESVEITKDTLVASQWQSKQAIDAVNRQIATSEEQAREALHNQYKPIIIPWNRPISDDAVTYRINIKNLGAGVALNVWGVFTTLEQSVICCTEQRRILGPNSGEIFSFNTKGASLYTCSEFEGYPVFVQSNGNSNFSPEMHLMLTYTDTFNNNWLVDFDYNSSLGWQQWAETKQIEKRLDQLAVKRGHLLPQQLGKK